MASGGGYVGSSLDAAKIRKQEKLRQEQRKHYEDMEKQSKDRIESSGLRQFGVSSTEALEHAFKNETVGLVSKAEFIAKRTTMQERLEEEMRKHQQHEEDARLQEKERRKRDKNANKPKLSFLADEEEEGGDVLPSPSGPAPTSANDSRANGASGEAGPSGHSGTMDPPAAKRTKFAKLGKDPTVSTDFLPDKDRERAEEELRAQLRREWQAEVDKVKAEKLEITYSYWDGTGHRRKIVVTKGDTIGSFLKAVREQLATQFREMRTSSVDNLIYVKEDLMMPHHFSFYELIVNKARGKSGPLFDFGVHEDIRLVNDASVEKNEAHAGKVVERHWYDKNKHIFPASRWETYDPEKDYGSYTIYGN